MTQRRDFLKHVSVFAALGSLPGLGRAAPQRERPLRLYNTHTGATIRTTYWADGAFIAESMQDINKLLRDHRNNQIAVIDPKVVLLLDQVSSQVKPGSDIHIISGYRSPASNQLLADTTNGVAKHSMHLEGRAIDLRMPGVPLASLRQAALNVAGGGVGYYPDSQFVHIDTGRVRRW